MSGSGVFSRRRFLALGTAASAGTVVLIACQQAPAAPAAPPTAPPQVVTQVVTQVVEKQVTQVVEKQVTQVVEKQVVVTPTPQPAVKGALDAWTFPLTDDDQAYIWKPLMLKFSQRYSQIQPKIEVLPWSGRREKMLAAYAAGSPPDVAYVNSDTLSLFGSNGVLQDAGSLVAQEVWADIPAEVTKLGITWKGKKILTPAFVFGSSHLANVSLLGELGYGADTTTLTWQDVLDLGAKAKAKNLYATSWSTTDWGDFVQTVWQAGGTVYSEDVTKVLLDQPPAEEALTFWADSFQKGFVPKEGAVGSEQEASVASVNYFYTNKQVLSAESDSGYVTQTVKQAPNLKFSVLQPFKNKQQFNLANSGGWGIFNKSKNTEATAIWVNFMMEPENDGFYCSLAGQAPSRLAAQTFWVADSNARKFLALTQPSLRTNQDSNYFWQEGKTTTAPHFQAAVLGKTPVKQALADATKELQKVVDDFWAKAKG